MTIKKTIKTLEDIKTYAYRLDIGRINAHGRALTWTDLEEKALSALYEGGHDSLFIRFYDKMDGSHEYFSISTFMDALDDILDELRGKITT